MKFVKFAAALAAVLVLGTATASAELIFEENFENESSNDNWTGRITTTTSEYLSGDKALYWNDCNTLNEISGVTAGNYVYEMWIYDTVKAEGENNSGCMMFGVTYEEGGVCQIGFKSNAWNGWYLIGHRLDGDDIDTAGVKRSPGWHQFVIDLTESPKASYYVDGKKVKEKSIAAAGTVKGVAVINPWNAGGAYSIDDIRVWESIDEVPPYENAEVVIENKNAVPIESTDISVSFKSEMNTDSYDGAVILEDKNGNAVAAEIADADETSFKVVPKEPLKYETKYKLTLKSSVRSKRFNSKLKGDITAEFTTEKNPFQITSFGFRDENGNLSNKYKSGSFALGAKFTNKSDKEIPVTVFCVLYEVKDGKLCHVGGAMKSEILSKSDDAYFLECAPVTIPDEGEYVLKGFIWSGLDNKNVLKKSIVVKKS